MKNPLDVIKAAWKDPKKKPWVLAGAGATTGVAVLALRRPADDPDAETAESVAADGPIAGGVIDSGIASGGDLAAAGSVPVGGSISYPIYDGGPSYDAGLGGSGYYDPGLEETDFSDIHAAMDEQRDELEDQVSDGLEATKAQQKQASAKARERAKKQGERISGLEQKTTKQGKKIVAQKKTNRKIRREMNRVTQRTKKASSSAKKPSKPKASSSPKKKVSNFNSAGKTRVFRKKKKGGK